MHSLQDICRKKILIIVAHPDDETLWCFQSIQLLKEKNDVLILCMTYTAVSKRGKELQAVAEKYGLKVVFGHCEDTGINKLLRNNELRQAFIKVFSKYRFDFVITHPPHGGEKPHPHHLQVYLATKEFSKYHNYTFGFFSERKILQKREPGFTYFLNIKNKKFILYRIIQGYKLMTEDGHRLSFAVSMLFDLIFTRGRFYGFEIAVNVKQKQEALMKYASQEDILKTYNSYYKKSEFLFLQYSESHKLSA